MNLPSFKKINQAAGIDAFTQHYFECSGFQVNREYFESNQVFGIYVKGSLIGGFVLGTGTTLRTLEVFASETHRSELYNTVQYPESPTEMCCFWSAPAFRQVTWLNFYTWVCVAYAMQFHSTSQLIYGTCSARLAALYSNASQSRVLHTDNVNGRRTFIFIGPRKYCLLGVAEILLYKAKRLLKIKSDRHLTHTRTATNEINIFDKQTMKAI